MRRVGVLICAVLALFLISSVNPYAYSIHTDRVNESFTPLFSTAADGDVSSESIGEDYSNKFRETTDDDVLFYPDSFFNDTYLAHAGKINGTAGYTPYGSYTDTHVLDAGYYGVKPDMNEYAWLYLNFTVPTDVEYVELAVYSKCENTLRKVYVYNFDSSSWWEWATLDTTYTWNNITTLTSDYWDNGVLLVQFENFLDAGTSTMYVDYAELKCWVMHLADSDHYAESFADVSDWTEYGGSFEAGDGFSSDGDLLELEVGYQGSASTDLIESDVFSGLSTSYYYELRWKTNATYATTGARIYLWLRDADGDRYQWYIDATDTDWHTQKDIISGMQQLDGAVGDIVQANIVAYAPNSGDACNHQVDYLRIGPSTEMGWQHDGSTTAGVTDDGDGDFTYTKSSDGDILTLTTVFDTGGGTQWGDFLIEYDTTTTAADIETTYYPFFEIRWRCTEINGGKVYFAIQGDGKKHSPLGSYHTSTFGWTTERINFLAETTVGTNAYLDFVFASDTAGENVTIEIDYAGFCSIANWSITQSGAGTDDYLYVDSGVLYSSIDDGYIELNHDPALSVSDTYPVWNLTTGSTAPQFSDYVSSWSSYSSETRGALQSGTVTDTRLKFTADGDISAIKFISDSTAPDADIMVSPNPPQDDEQITLSSIVFDDVEVWKVWYNAISYPTGFSDVNYSATEGQENYWSYSFSSLIAGDYCFKVIANDGANNSTVTESNRDYATVRFTVREAEITVTTYTLIGASSDFDYMHYSFLISHDCTFIIEEWSDSWAKNETHSGSVSEGDCAIAWDKIGVDDIDANYTITFTNDSLTRVIDGCYLTAYKALQVTEIDFVNLEQSDNWATNLTINFYTNKEVDWTVYDRDADDAVLHSGTTTEGDGFITWVKNNARGAHQFAVKWEDGVSEQFYNNSYWIYERNIDDLPGGADPGADQRRTIEFWATIAAISGILGIIVIGLSHYNMDEKIKNLPNYRTQERGRR